MNMLGHDQLISQKALCRICGFSLILCMCVLYWENVFVIVHHSQFYLKLKNTVLFGCLHCLLYINFLHYFSFPVIVMDLDF